MGKLSPAHREQGDHSLGGPRHLYYAVAMGKTQTLKEVQEVD